VLAAGQQFSKRNITLIKTWLNSPCHAIGSESDRPVRIDHTYIHIGRSNIHYTHSLHTLKGLVYCNDCGAYSQKHKLHKLADECEPPTKWGLESRRALRAGRLPRKLNQWPCESEQLVHSAPSPVIDEAAVVSNISDALDSVVMPAFVEAFMQPPSPSDDAIHDEPCVENATPVTVAAPSVGLPSVSHLDNPDLSMSESD
jgi:hypothetical protein